MAYLKKISTSCSMLVACASTQAELTGYRFIDDISLTGKLRTVSYYVENTYLQDHPDPADPRYRKGAWTAGLQVNIQTGYLADFLALGGSFYGAAKIHMDENKMKDSYQLLDKNNEGFTKAGQLYADFKCGDKEKDPVSGNFRAGRQSLYTGLISSSGSRTVPSTWQGYNLNTKIYRANFKLAYVDKMSLRNEAGFNTLEDFNGNKIDYILGTELGYTFDLTPTQTLNLKYRNAFARDFLQAHNAAARWTIPFSETMALNIEGQYYYTKKDGDLWNGKVFGDPSFNDDASAAFVAASVELDGWDFQLAVSHVKAEGTHKAPGAGYQQPSVYYYDFGSNTHGIWESPTSGFAEDMIYDGETTWMAGVGYDLSTLGARGLKVGYNFHYGSGMEVMNTQGKKKNVSEHEHDMYVHYALPDEILKGLVFKLEYGIYRNDRELREAIGTEKNDLRVWLDYNFTLL